MAKRQERPPELMAVPKLGRVERRIVRALAFLRRPDPAEMPENMMVTVRAIAKAQASQGRALEED